MDVGLFGNLGYCLVRALSRAHDVLLTTFADDGECNANFMAKCECQKQA